jgi:hypothetical protein
MTSLQIECVGYMCNIHHHTLAKTMWQIQLNVFKNHSLFIYKPKYLNGKDESLPFIKTTW